MQKQIEKNRRQSRGEAAASPVTVAVAVAVAASVSITIVAAMRVIFQAAATSSVMVVSERYAMGSQSSDLHLYVDCLFN